MDSVDEPTADLEQPWVERALPYLSHPDHTIRDMARLIVSMSDAKIRHEEEPRRPHHECSPKPDAPHVFGDTRYE